MGFTPQRKLFVGLACLAGGALVVDRFVLSEGGPASAEAAVAEAAEATAPAAAESPVRIVTVADRLALVTAQLPASRPENIFGLPAAWAAEVPRVEAPAEKVAEAPELAPAPRLTAIIGQGDHFVARIGGKSYQTGDVYEWGGASWTIAAIDGRSVTFSRDSAVRTIELADKERTGVRASARPQGRGDGDR